MRSSITQGRFGAKTAAPYREMTRQQKLRGGGEMRPALTILPMSVETLWKPYKSDSRHLRETTSCFSDQQLGGDLSRADSQLALSHYSLFPSSPNDFTGAVVGNRHYSPGTIEVHPLYSGATYGTRRYRRCYSGVPVCAL